MSQNDGTVESSDRSQRVEEPYSAFTIKQKRFIVVMIACVSLFSPLSSFIYYPAISTIATDLSVTIEQVNLGVTTYMVVSGIAPAILADIADKIGRRPVIIGVLSLFCAANVGLALQRNYAALLILRMVQSAGSSGTISLAYGVISDITTPAERGSYVGFVLIGPNAAPPLGPVLGGVLAHRAGWPWIFWFLCILSGVILMTTIAYLPETARTIVGNGSTEAEKMNFVPFSRQTRPESSTEKPSVTNGQRSWAFPNPLTCLRVLFKPDAAIIIGVNGIFYMVYCGVQATLSSLFIKIYNLNQLEAGLIYLPFGVACIFGSIAFGKLMNYDFKKTAKNAGLDSSETAKSVSDFPIEIARYRSVWLPLSISIAAFIGYGWSLESQTSIAAPLVMQFLLGAMTTGVFNMCGTLLTDLHPEKPSTAQAALNLVRAVLAAVFTAVLQLIIDDIGVGWTFTIVAAFCFLTVPMILAEIQFGSQWREKRSRQVDKGG